MTETTFSHAEPVLYVSNVAETVRYWQEVLGFPNQWTSGDPPIHGGVSWHGAFIQFSQRPELAAKVHGESVWMRVSRIEALYALHQKKGANVVMSLARQTYGFDEYVIKDLNGYYITFASPSSGKETKSERLPETVRIVGRKPTPVEYRNLFGAVGWSTPFSDEVLQKQLDLMQYGVVAENAEDGVAIGCALLFGDGFSFYYVKDVMVHPDWQNKNVGTAIMHEISHWLDENAPDKAMVSLFTGENLKPFYQQFNFGVAYGMVRTIHKNEK